MRRYPNQSCGGPRPAIEAQSIPSRVVPPDTHRRTPHSAPERLRPGVVNYPVVGYTYLLRQCSRESEDNGPN